ncbi:MULTISPECIES: hypothetical protein [Klebsiella]|uniref:hypothetical protein n=1 Tax=Klebsiella TaxID=570 RepID=UPI0010F572A8|nr:hypothetical protein [Klebsiella quasipneumoniae]GKP91727.1 hypothetical protein NUKP71_27960 [Klebsiella quasipneumoniae]HBT6084002.1 hypothetical protein [Klebsiella quasipneumoniae]HBT6129193.1 hypothetical protein [Klebsiella quasipneumoniae]HBT6223026.1 hypothetical protein [Klebsiella quasipneumoniae]HBT6245856.1 hypothetical protein [Klebsiella quasipneumoniae]
MTDITELVQREKFEAWVMTQICISKSTLEGLRTSDGYRNSTLSGSDYNLMWNLWKAAGAELVEALEKAQQRIDELEFIRTSADKVQREFANELGCAGDNESILQAIEDLKQQAESRTVTVENLQESAYRAGLTAGWNLGLANNNEGFNKCLAAHAAGIKVEAK